MYTYIKYLGFFFLLNLKKIAILLFIFQKKI